MVTSRVLRAIVALLPALCCLGDCRLGADYPARPVRLIVPFAAGGPTDVIARDRRAEAVGGLGPAGRAPRTSPAPAATPASPWSRGRAADGYTMLVVSTGFIVNPSMYAKIPYDPVKDFSPITLVAASPNVISVNPHFPARRSRS